MLRVPAQDFEPLREAVEARLPSVRVLPHRASSFTQLQGRGLAYAEVAAGEGDAMRLVVILDDGRFYERALTVDPDDRVHSIATTLANTLAAIREERLEPTRDDVAIPLPAPEPTTVLPPPRPEVARPPVAATRSDSAPADVLTTPAKPTTTRRTELGLSAAGMLLAGLGPGGVSGPAGGAALDVDLRLPVGALLGTGVQHGTRGHAGARVHRFAIHIAGGHALRRRDFELRTIAGFVVEPWFVAISGDTRVPSKPGGGRSNPLLGAMLTTSPGWYWRRTPDAPVALRLGMRARVSVTSLASGGLGRVRVISGGVADEIARLGGVELLLGADATMWFRLGRSRASRPAARPGAASRGVHGP